MVNNGAAALVLATTALATGREVVVCRGELVEIGDGFRLPDLIESTGARLREVGTTNRTTLRDYADLDEPSWLRCRVLSFLGSSYFDDVKTRRTTFDGEALRLVAVGPRPPGVTTPGEEEVVGILDVELWSEEGEDVATIDTIAVHPDHQGSGIAGALLASALPSLRERGVAWLDAWTREDPQTCGWYESQGFAVDQTYLHVYRGGDEEVADPTGDEGFSAPFGLGAPLKGFFHGPDEDPEVWRARFARVHQCRRYLRQLDATSP